MAGALELDGLSRRFGTVTALDNLTFSVPAGLVVGFLGPNGAGKTTTMRAIFGLTVRDVGSVRWHGAPIGPTQRRRFGYYLGKQFTAALDGIEHRRIRPRRPQTNGKVERFNRTLADEWAYARDNAPPSGRPQ